MADRNQIDKNVIINMGNQYASLSIYDEYFENDVSVAESSRPIQNSPAMAGKLSKKSFQEHCYRILKQYVPSEEGKKLRSHYRDFVIRNEARSAEQRFQIVTLLSRYDLSLAGNYVPHFNRERDVLTNEKLLAIERAVGLKNNV